MALRIKFHLACKKLFFTISFFKPGLIMNKLSMDPFPPSGEQRVEPSMKKLWLKQRILLENCLSNEYCLREAKYEVTLA